MPQITISEAISWKKILETRHSEMLALRNSSAVKTTADYNGRSTTTVPMHDVRKLDKRVTLLARELRILDSAIKKANATTVVSGYNQDDNVLGELEDTSSK